MLYNSLKDKLITLLISFIYMTVKEKELSIGGNTMPKYARSTAYTGRKATESKSGESKFATQAQANAGTRGDLSISPKTLDDAIENLIVDGTTTTKGIVRLATVAETVAGALDTVANTPAGLAAVAIAGAPDASEILKGILELATQAEVTTGTDDARAITPLKFVTALASPPAIGGTAPASGAFTDLAATGVGTGNVMTSDTASSFSVTGALADLTLNSDAGRVIINGEEAADNAITIVSAAGGIDMDSALSTVISTSENTADALQLVASAGGIDITAAGAAGEDIDIVCTAGSVNITAGESAANSIVITSSIGGIDILAAGAAAGEDIDIAATGSSVNISASENAADAITVTASAGGVTIDAVGTAGEDITLTSTGSSINLIATEDAANAIYLHANGGTSETVKIHSDQGTGVASIEVASDVGGVTISGGVASADAVNIACGDAAGGVDIDSGTGGTILDSTGAISLDAAAASNFKVTGAGIDLTLESAAGRVVVNAEEAAADAITILSAAGGIDVDAALELNIATSEAQADALVINASAGGMDISCDGAGLDVDIASTAGRVTVTSGEAAADAIYLHADAGAGEKIRVHADQGTGADSIALTSDDGGITLTAGLASSDAMNIVSSAGGIDIDAALDIVITGTENATDSIYIHANGGATEQIRVHADQGTAVGSIQLESDVGGITALSGLASDDAINITASAGGVDIDGAMQVNIASSEAQADAVVITASNAAGGIDLTTGGGSVDISSAGFVTMVAGTDTQAGDTCTSNTNVFACTYTGFTTAAAASQVFVVTNSKISATSQVLLTVSNLGANDAQMQLTRVKQGAGTMDVTVKNVGAAALNGNVVITGWVIG